MSQTTTDLQISVEEPAAWSRRLVITVPANRVRSERSKVASRLSKRVRIPGFRKGKVPPERLEARFGAEIDRQTRQRVIERAFQEAVETKDLDPISEPRVANVSYDRDAELTFEVAFDIRPEVKLARLGGFRVTRPEVSVSDDEIDEHVDLLRKNQATWKPVDRSPRAGDSVEVEITPLREGEEAEPESQPYQFVLGEGRAIPDVEEAIVSLSAGAADEFTVSFPDDFDDPERRGTSQRLRIELKQVLEQELPDLDDEFARSVGDFENLAALREAVAEDLRRRKEHEGEAHVNQQIVEQILEANPFEVPESMIERYVEALIGTPGEGTDREALEQAREEARPAAEWGIRRTLILQRIAEDQGLAATKDEVRERVQALAKRAGRPFGEVQARLAKSGELQDIERRIKEEKVFEYLREQSEIQTGA